MNNTEQFDNDKWTGWQNNTGTPIEYETDEELEAIIQQLKINPGNGMPLSDSPFYRCLPKYTSPNYPLPPVSEIAIKQKTWSYRA
jgi:hypothetical protein